jgi:hypothetical protein
MKKCEPDGEKIQLREETRLIRLENQLQHLVLEEVSKIAHEDDKHEAAIAMWRTIYMQSWAAIHRIDPRRAPRTIPVSRQ